MNSRYFANAFVPYDQHVHCSDLIVKQFEGACNVLLNKEQISQITESCPVSSEERLNLLF